MSTLGGSRGERNAKPKFSALDINRMYKNSRGETSEPSAQKNQVPRKHGMQILGKVPSARRPPANLPSLKAEISSPTANNNTTITSSPREEASKNSATISASSSGNQISTTTALIKNSNNPSNFGNKNNNNSASVVGIGSKLINNSSNFGGGNSNTAQQQRNISTLSNHGNNQYHQQQPITWSAVTTGSDSSNNKVGVGSKTSIPPLYQSPQFQYEFPSLDGTVGGVGSGGTNSIKKDQSNQHTQQIHHQSQQNLQSNSQQQPNQPNQRDSQHGRHSYDHSSNFAHDCRDGNESDEECGTEGAQRDFHEVSLRPQTDAAAWLQQQEKSAKNSMESASNLLGPAPPQSGNMTSVPMPILALMPSFMQRGAPGSSSGITVGNSSGISSTPINNQNGISGKEYSSQLGSNSSRLHRTGAKHNSNSQEPINYRTGSSINKRSAPPTHGSQSSNSGIGMRKEKEFMVEPEIAQMQRPIIREEDLERLNAIANDDSWTKQDDIDYTKKLTFSDDESPEENTSLQDRERLYDKSTAENVSGISDIRKNSTGNNSCSGSNWQRSGNDSRNSSERERSTEFDHDVDQRQQNGSRSSATGPNISIESSVYERMKQRKEEEERREMERKQGAAKKLQELEKKLNKKNATSNVIGDCLEQPNTATTLDSNSGEDQQQSQMRRSVGSGGRTDYDRVQREIRSIGDFNRSERGSNSNATGSTNNSSVKPIFSAQFQSNLPPRFQRQQQMQAQQSGQQTGHTGTNNNGSRSITSSGSGGVEKSASIGSTFDSGRHVQKGALQQRGSGGRNDYRDNYMRNSGGYGRNRNDLDRDDERYNRGRNDDYMRGNNQSKLSRSVSDTSQRKTSVSSNDESVKFGPGESKDFGGAALVSSWAEETDTELKRHRDESFSSSHSHESIPIKILQRPNTQKSVTEDAPSNWNQQLSEQSENDDTHFVPTQILRRSESNEEKSQNSSLKSGSNEMRKTGEEKSHSTSHNQNENSPSVEVQNASQKDGSGSATLQSSANSKKDTIVKPTTVVDEKTTESNKSEVQTQREPKRSSSRASSGRDRDKDRERERDRGTNLRNYGYRGGRDSNTWSNRGSSMRSGGGRYYNSNEQPFQSESEHSEGVEEDTAYGNTNQRKEHSSKAPRKDHGRRGGGNSYNIDERGFKEGFAPRGEPSRRGRGGGGTIGDRGSSMSYRRNNDNRHMGGSGNQARQYGRQPYDENKTERSIDSKQSGSSAEVDKTKQNQIALSAGLSNKGKDTPLASSNSSFKQQNLQNSAANSQLKKSNDVDNATSISMTNAGNNSTRKDHTLSSKNDENNSEREKKSSSKEKDNACIQSMGQRNSSNVIGNTTKKVDLPMTSLSTSATPIASKSNQQQIIAKPPPGLGGLKSGSSTPTMSGVSTSNSQAQIKQSTADLHKPSQSQLRSIAPESDKTKQNISIGDKASSNGNLLMDGAPVNTIIFENTNYKQQAQAAATSTTRSSDSVAATVSNVTGVNVSVVDTISNALSQMSFAKVSESSVTCAPSSSDYDKDMKLGFTFGDTEGYTNSSNVSTEPDVSAQQPSIVGKQQQQAQNIISTAELNMKIASVKKVWENVSPMTSVDNSSVLQQQQQQNLQHQVQQPLEVVDTSGHISAAASFVAAVAASQQQHQHQQHIPHYAVATIHMHQHHSLPSPVQNTYNSHNSAFDSTQLDQQFGQGSNIVVGGDEANVVYSQQQQQSAPQQQTQVLKHPDVVKQQQAATPKQLQQQHGSTIGMSPPPTLQQQQQHQQQHQQSAAQLHTAAHQPFYQASAQFTGIPTIPSPPAVVFNSSQIPPPSQAGLYAPFHSLDHSSRSQFSAAAAHSFPGHYNAPAAGGPFNAYTMQTPPNLATAPTPDMYTSLTSQFRMGGGGPSPFGNPNSQQMNNANAAAVAIISSNSNSLMSSVGSVKPPSSQQLGTIGSKGGGGGGPYAAAAQQYMNLYAGPPQHPQSGPTAHQLQSNNYYSNSGGPNGPPYYGAPPPPQNNPAGAQNYGLAAAAASLYGSHQGGPPGSNSGQGPQSQHTLSNFNTPFMNSPLLTAASINQYRGGPNQGAATYLKSNQNQNHLQDSMGRQLKSPLGADVSLNIAKQVQSQSSPPHHKNYGTWDIQNQVMQQQSQQQQQVSQQRGGTSGNTQNMNTNNRSGNSVSSNAQQCQQPGNVNISMGVSNSGSGINQGRYPTPIQRPTNYPPHSQVGSQQQSSQQGQRPTNLRQASNTGIQSNGSNGPHNTINNTGGNGGSNNSVNSSHSGTGGQPPQMNKSPYYSNNANSGASRANHT